MKSRERIKKALSHIQPDILPVDFGSTPVSGIHSSVVYKLRQYFGLDKPGVPVKVIEPYQMLGEIKEDLKQIIGIDCISLEGQSTFFGFKNKDWKEWKLNDGTPVLVPGLFNTIFNKDGSLFQYPMGNKRYKASGKMPKGGFFFDAIIRQEDFNKDNMDPRDNLEEYGIISAKDLDYLKSKSFHLFNNSEYAIVGMIADSGFGDIAFIPGIKLKNPKGIRDIEEWYISIHSRKNHVKKIFEGQMEIAIGNYQKIYQEIGNKINAVMVSATDFGAQNGLFLSIDTYRELFKPFHVKVNKWIHDNTSWKTFIHTCGSIFDLIPDLIEAGFDILNPVQISAHEMDPKRLKKEYGKDIVFWGGGVDTQKTLPLSSPEDVKKQVRELIEIFSPGGGFVYSTVHNIQINVPIENILAMIEVIQDYRR